MQLFRLECRLCLNVYLKICLVIRLVIRQKMTSPNVTADGCTRQAIPAVQIHHAVNQILRTIFRIAQRNNDSGFVSLYGNCFHFHRDSLTCAALLNRHKAVCQFGGQIFNNLIKCRNIRRADRNCRHNAQHCRSCNKRCLSSLSVPSVYFPAGAFSFPCLRNHICHKLLRRADRIVCPSIAVFKHEYPLLPHITSLSVTASPSSALSAQWIPLPL